MIWASSSASAGSMLLPASPVADSTPHLATGYLPSAVKGAQAWLAEQLSGWGHRQDMLVHPLGCHPPLLWNSQLLRAQPKLEGPSQAGDFMPQASISQTVARGQPANLLLPTKLELMQGQTLGSASSRFLCSLDQVPWPP
jgi:hypothetical protein